MQVCVGLTLEEMNLMELSNKSMYTFDRQDKSLIKDFARTKNMFCTTRSRADESRGNRDDATHSCFEYRSTLLRLAQKSRLLNCTECLSCDLMVTA